MSDVAEVKEAPLDLSRLRAALDEWARRRRAGGVPDTDTLNDIVVAARRWVRLVDGLDYEAAVDAFFQDWRDNEITDTQDYARALKVAIDAAVGVEKEIGDE